MESISELSFPPKIFFKREVSGGKSTTRTTRYPTGREDSVMYGFPNFYNHVQAGAAARGQCTPARVHVSL